jgi:hypothetical protein
MSKPIVFVSYSHKDEQEKNLLVSHLKVAENTGAIKLWVDDDIPAGADWYAEVKQAIERARVVMLLVSANFLTSDFILREEVPAVLKRRAAEGLTVFPVIAKACAWNTVGWLAAMNVRPKNGRPIWSGTGSRIDEDLARITHEVIEVVQRGDTDGPAGQFLKASPESAAPVAAGSNQDRQHLENLLDIKTRRLYKLQQQAAMYGISTPPEVQIQIEDLEVEIAAIKQQLK